MTEVVNWIWGAPTLEERLQRIEEFLTNEGYSLPTSPKGVDRSEQGEKHVVYGEVWTVEYSVLDQAGRKRHCCATGCIITVRTRLTTSCWSESSIAMNGPSIRIDDDKKAAILVQSE